MKIIEIRKLSKEKIEKEILTLGERLLELRFQTANNSLQDFSQVKKNKKIIARLKTALKERELNDAK